MTTSIRNRLDKLEQQAKRVRRSRRNEHQPKMTLEEIEIREQELEREIIASVKSGEITYDDILERSVTCPRLMELYNIANSDAEMEPVQA